MWFCHERTGLYLCADTSDKKHSLLEPDLKAMLEHVYPPLFLDNLQAEIFGGT